MPIICGKVVFLWTFYKNLNSQVGYGVQFATLYVEGEDQFEGVDHHQDEMVRPLHCVG